MRNLAEHYATPPATLTNHAIFNLNQLLILLSSSSGEDSKFNGSSAQDVLNSAFAKIKEWLHSLIHKFDELFPPETRDEKVHHWLTEALHWLGVALPYLIVGLIIILCLFCCAMCCCPCIMGVCQLLLCCLKGVWGMCCGCLNGVWRMCCGCLNGVWRMCCGCFRRSGGGRMMKAPGLDGSVIIPRNWFEGNPRSYFLNLRSGKSIDKFY